MAFPGGRRFNRPGDDCQLERGGIGGCCSWDDCQLGERRVHWVVAVLCTMLLLDVIATILGQGIGSDSFVSVASGDGVFWMLSDWRAMPIERLQVVGLRWGRYMFVELATHFVWPRPQHCATTEICCMLCTMGVCQWRLGTFLKAFDLSAIKELMYRDYTDAEGDVCCHLHGFAVFCSACPLVHVWRSPFSLPVSPLLASIPLL
jgi:hypothetical protein